MNAKNNIEVILNNLPLNNIFYRSDRFELIEKTKHVQPRSRSQYLNYANSRFLVIKDV